MKWTRRPCRLGLLFGCCLGLLAAQAHAAGRVYAARVPGGAIRVLVVVTEGPWPAGGVRVEDAGGAVLLANGQGDPPAPGELDAATQNALGALQRAPSPVDASAKSGNTILALRVLSDWTFAQAAGVGVELPAGAHPSSVRVVLLGTNGTTITTLGPVTVQNDPGPPAPTSVRAEANAAGVTLRWQTALAAQAVPAYAYTVQRSFGTEHNALTLHPQLLTIAKPGQAIPYVDHAPPVETALSYELRLVDVLGVASAPVSAEVYSPDFTAGAPPAGQTAKAVRGFVTLTWTPPPNPRASGLMVERSQLLEGPYEWLTPDGLAPQSSQFEDHNVMPGANYYYRVRTVTPKGALGPPADPVHAQVLAANPLNAPQGLAADVGRSQIVLTWKPVAGVSLAGYIIERRATASSPRWSRLNSRLAPEARFVDAIGPSRGGSFEYRVTAVATDEGQSPPSQILRVTLLDTEPPPAPLVLVTSGEEGRVQIRFAAAEPAEKTAQVALLRSDSPTETGLVVGSPVAAASGMIEDNWVRAGQAYWYRLIAFDKSGNRSTESDAYGVRVGAVALPTPKAPTVAYVAQPTPQMSLSFEPPPPHARVIVQVQLADGRWRNVMGPMAGNSAVDLAPPGPHANYRIVYVAEGGGAGSPSAASSPK